VPECSPGLRPHPHHPTPTWMSALQSTALQGGAEVTMDLVYQTTGKPHPNDITALLEHMLNSDFNTAFASLCSGLFYYPFASRVKRTSVSHPTLLPCRLAGCWELKTAKGLALQDIISEMHDRLLHVSMPASLKCDVFDQLSTIASVHKRECQHPQSFHLPLLSSLCVANMHTSCVLSCAAQYRTQLQRVVRPL